MNDYSDIITQDDIENNMTNAVMDNNAASETGIAMIGDVTKIIDGEAATIRVYFELREGEEPDNEAIYTVDRIIRADMID